MDHSSSERISHKAPISCHVTSGIVTKPSRFADGQTMFRDSWKLDILTVKFDNSIAVEVLFGGSFNQART